VDGAAEARVAFVAAAVPAGGRAPVLDAPGTGARAPAVHAANPAAPADPASCKKWRRLGHAWCVPAI